MLGMGECVRERGGGEGRKFQEFRSATSLEARLQRILSV